MKTVLKSKTFFLVIIIALISIMASSISLNLLQDRTLTRKIRQELQKSLNQSGLKIRIGNIHWFGWNRLACREIILTDSDDHQIPFEIGRLNIKLDLLSLLKDRRHPENALREVELVDFRIKLRRFDSGKWNIQKYFPRKNRPLQLQTNLKIIHGTVELEDFQYGRYQLTDISGKVNFTCFPEVDWNLKGKSPLNSALWWTSQGKTRIDQKVGLGNFLIRKASLAKLSFLLKKQPYPLEFKSGFVDFDLDFIWNRGVFSVKSGRTTISNSKIHIANLKESFQVRHLQAEFTAARLNVLEALILYKQTTIRASGEVNPKNVAIKGNISAKNFQLEDLSQFSPNLEKMLIQGRADLRLEIAGFLDAPVLNGEIILNDSSFNVAEQGKIKEISGRIFIVNNNLQIERLEGSWSDSPIGISGTIFNLLKPSLNLKIYGYDLNIDNTDFAQLVDPSLQIGGKNEFLGQITGNPENLLFSGEARISQLTYKGYSFTNLKVKIEWNSHTKSLQILEFNGNIWGANLAAVGQILIDEREVSWRVSGKATDLNLEKIDSGFNSNLGGKVETDIYLKGTWEFGRKFEPGIILGTFQGEKIHFQDARIDTVGGVFSWIDGNLMVDSIQVRIGQGMVYGHLQLNKKGVFANISAENIKLRQLLPNEKKYPLNGIFEGSFIFEGPLQQLAGKIYGTLEEATWSSKPIGAITGNLLYENSGFEIVDLKLSNDSGDITVDGRLDWGTQPSLAVNVNSSNFNLKGLSKWLPFSTLPKMDGYGSVSLKVAGPLVNPNFNGEIQLSSPSIGNILMEEGLIQFDGNLQEFSLRKCRLANQDSSLELWGAFKWNNLDLEIQGHAVELELLPLRFQGYNLYGKVDFQGKLTGKPENPTLTVALTGRDLNFGRLNYPEFTGKLTWDSNGIEIHQAQLNRGKGSLNVMGRFGLKKPVQLDLGIKFTEFDIKELVQLMKVPGLQIEGQMSGLTRIAGTIDQPVVRLMGSITEGFLNSIPITGEVDLFYSQNKVSIQKIQLEHGTGVLYAGGLWESGRQLQLNLQLKEFPLETINSFTNHQMNLTGITSSIINLEWKNNEINGDLLLDINNLSINDYHLGDLHLEGEFSDQGLSIADGLLTFQSGYLSGAGYLPWPVQQVKKLKLPIYTKDDLRNSNLELNFKNAPADLINIVARGFTVLEGELNGELQIKGDLLAPHFFGDLDCKDVKLNITALELPIENFQAAVHIDNNMATIKKARGNYGRGKLNLAGQAELIGFQSPIFNIGMVASRIYYKNYFFDGFGDLDVKLTGTIKKSLISGKITAYNCKVGILGTRPQKRPLLWKPNLNINIQAGKNVRYRQVGLADITTEGMINVKGNIEAPLLQGEVYSDRGVLTFYGQTFKVNRGKAKFEYSQGDKPYVEVDSSLTYPKVEVILTIKGQIGGNITINLTSQPYLTQNDLYALLNWSELRGDKPMTVNGIVSGNISFLTDTIFGDVFYQLRRALNVDYLYLEHDFRENDFRINVGDYVTDDLFLSYSRLFNDTSKDNWGIDLHLTPRLVAGTSYTMDYGTSWRLTYKIQF